MYVGGGGGGCGNYFIPNVIGTFVYTNYSTAE